MELTKGCIPQPEDPRDYKIDLDALGGSAAITEAEWDQGFHLPEPPDSDQAQAERCVGEAWSYLHWQKKGKVFSPRDIYSQIYLPAGGAVLRDGGKLITKSGQQTRVDCGDPSPNNETNNRIKCLNPGLALPNLEENYHLITNFTAAGVAWGIKNLGGLVMGVRGDQKGWGMGQYWDLHKLEYPVPPVAYEWGHALYAFGFQKINGIKYIICKSSWCNTGVKRHYLPESYFLSGNTFDGWVLIPKGQVMNSYVKTLNLDGEVGAFIPLSDPNQVDLLNKIFDLNIIVAADGTIATDLTAHKA